MRADRLRLSCRQRVVRRIGRVDSERLGRRVKRQTGHRPGAHRVALGAV